MDINGFVSLLEETKTSFINEVKKERGRNHKLFVDDSGYSEFNILSDEYFEQKWFDPYLESFIRNDLINPVLYEIINDKYGKDWDIEWSGISTNLIDGFNNTEYENEYNPLEFVIDDDNKKVGFRYSEISSNHFEEIGSLFFGKNSKYNLDQLIILSFGGSAFEYESWDIKGMSFEEFFNAYFEECCYDLFRKYVVSSIDEAKRIIALKTVQQITPKYLSTYRFVIEDRFISSNVDNYHAFGTHLRAGTRASRIFPDINRRSRILYNSIVSLPDHKKFYSSIIGERLFTIYIKEGSSVCCFSTVS